MATEGRKFTIAIGLYSGVIFNKTKQSLFFSTDQFVYLAIGWGQDSSIYQPINSYLNCENEALNVFLYPFRIAEFVLNWLVGRPERKGPQNEAVLNQLANTTWGETRVLNNRCNNSNLYQNDVFFLRAWPLTLLSSSSSTWRSETEKCLSRSTSISLNNLKKENNKPLMRNLCDFNLYNFHRVQTSNASHYLVLYSAILFSIIRSIRIQ